MTKKTWDTENDHYQRKTGRHIQMGMKLTLGKTAGVDLGNNERQRNTKTRPKESNRSICKGDRLKSFQWILIKMCRGVEWACANNPWNVALRPPMVHHGQLYLSVYLDILVENWQKACSDVTFTFHTCLSCKLHKKTKWKCTKYKTTPLESELRFVLSLFLIFIRGSSLANMHSVMLQIPLCCLRVAICEPQACWGMCQNTVMTNQLIVPEPPLQLNRCIYLFMSFFLGKPKQKVMGKAVKTPSLTWMESLPPPPPIEELKQCEQDDELPENMDLGWVTVLPPQMHISLN